MEPKWLRLEDVLYIHEQSITGFGGLDGLRDQALLESAFMRPQQLWAYGDPSPDLESLAASLAVGLAKNHPFLDGNKRTAFMAVSVFLRINGLYLDVSEAKAEAVMVSVAAGGTDDGTLAIWLRSNVVPTED